MNNDKPKKNTTLIWNLLDEYGVSVSLISRALKVDRLTVLRALDPNQFHRCIPLTLSAVRGKCVEQLRVMGWQGSPDDLWIEYHHEAAA